MIEKPEIKDAKNTDLKEAVFIGFDESFTSLEECFYDLSDADTRAFPIPGRNNIAWIVMHSLMNLDMYGPFTLAFVSQPDGGEHRTCYDWSDSSFQMARRPQVGDEFPSVQDMLKRLRHIRRATFELLGGLSCEDLRKPVRDWWSHASDSCMRTIHHTNAHVRQIWLLRGALGLTDGKSWPQQHWA